MCSSQLTQFTSSPEVANWQRTSRKQQQKPFIPMFELSSIPRALLFWAERHLSINKTFWFYSFLTPSCVPMSTPYKHASHECFMPHPSNSRVGTTAGWEWFGLCHQTLGNNTGGFTTKILRGRCIVQWTQHQGLHNSWKLPWPQHQRQVTKTRTMDFQLCKVLF